jgi:hypothetical protein
MTDASVTFDAPSTALVVAMVLAALLPAHRLCQAHFIDRNCRDLGGVLFLKLI